jgi:hypothetical protein
LSLIHLSFLSILIKIAPIDTYVLTVESSGLGISFVQILPYEDVSPFFNVMGAEGFQHYFRCTVDAQRANGSLGLDLFLAVVRDE